MHGIILVVLLVALKRLKKEMLNAGISRSGQEMRRAKEDEGEEGKERIERWNGEIRGVKV